MLLSIMNLDYLQLASLIHSNVKKQIEVAFNKNIIIINNVTKPFLEITILELRNFINNALKTEFLEVKVSSDSYSDLDILLAFPIGINGDRVVAHYTPFQLSKQMCSNLPYYLNPISNIKEYRILKIDYGIAINGNIIDKAFSLNIDNSDEVNTLINTSELAVNKVIESMGIDMRLNELADIAREIVESTELNEKPLKIVENVYSHNILPWKVHGAKFIKPDWTKDENTILDLKINENEQWAIEIYCSNGSGKGELVNNIETFSHYKIADKFIDFNKIKTPIFALEEYNKLMSEIKYPLPFCLNRIAIKKNKKKLSCFKIAQLCQDLHTKGVLESYPPIVESFPEDCIVSQIEKNVIVGSYKVEL